MKETFFPPVEETNKAKRTNQEEPKRVISTSIKWVMLGGCVGKTSLCDRLFHGCFYHVHESTVGAACTMQGAEHSLSKKKFRLEVWVTCGKERYATLVPLYCRGANLVIVVYSIDDRGSFSYAERWLKEIGTGTGEINFALIGARCDRDRERKILYDEGLKLAQQYNAFFCETSAKQKINTDTLVDQLISLCYLYYSLKGFKFE
eukprot:Phypoly_transcript_19628.p1 GENE.Phypoly_transcript_19628~~Phypoly_transcript_19628.p1  ORF type:complete len:234 (+),score=28.10 Phypoly_transcript_19628:91-702(+)